ncbi:uncharacterized protein LOC106669620 [Cimex lectularius]|uniref:Chitin-binding type-2 domain-containing protein n=1 Tax=Cimex lectularius TaxID=79782 RepID=A0A8I6RZX3_CIMLE|nr:uncharacterized protein LOC106669620 [Cimex lectularius]
MIGIITGLIFCVVVSGMPRIRVDRSIPLERFTLPDNATSIRENIDTSFSCNSKPYGYYADPENDCQLFHVCLPVAFDGRRSETFMWSFICPQETVFNQERFTCARPEDSIPCQESAMFYSLNEKFGQSESEEETPVVDQEMEANNSLEEETAR